MRGGGHGVVALVNERRHTPLVAPYGGREARFVTNPICRAIPGRPERNAPTSRVMLDMSTSGIAFGKACVAMEEGKPGAVVATAVGP